MKKTTKFISIILSVAMLISMLSTLTFAAGYEIKFGQKLTLTVKPDEVVSVKFVPEKTSSYIIKSEPDDVDTGAYVADAYDLDIGGEYFDDTDECYAFYLKCDLETGKEYYINVYTYSDKKETFDLVIECGHNFEGSRCVVCGEVCDHTEMGDLGCCPCGAVFWGTDIKAGDEYEVETEDYYEVCWFRFIPEVSGVYAFRSISDILDADPDCALLDADGECLTESYDVNGMDFELFYNFVAGETYYFGAYNCYESGAFSVALEHVTHTADDGSVHELEFVEGIDSNCTEHGVSDGLYCNDCEVFVEGYEELELDPTFHIDDDWDAFCDLCGVNLMYCDHICHSESPVLMFIWQIANFFHSLFGISPVCYCGEVHY